MATMPRLLEFVGPRDHAIDGVPQADVEVVFEPVDETQVTEETATVLVASGLYSEKNAVPTTDAAAAREV